MKSKELWIFLFILGTLLFNWPFLDIFSLALPYYLFGVWAFLIALIIIVVNLRQRRGSASDV